MKIFNTTLYGVIKHLYLSIFDIKNNSKKYNVIFTQINENTDTDDDNDSDIDVPTLFENQIEEGFSVEEGLSGASDDIKTGMVEHEDIPGEPKKVNVYKDVLEVLTSRRVDTAWINCDLQDISSKYGKLASVTTTVDDKLKIIINTGTLKFNSIKSNQLLVSLHIAECIFREVLYHTTGKVNVHELDTLIDQFYDQYYASLEMKLNNADD